MDDNSAVILVVGMFIGALLLVIAGVCAVYVSAASSASSEWTWPQPECWDGRSVPLPGPMMIICESTWRPTPTPTSTPTPEPTQTPEPTSTPEPTPEPLSTAELQRQILVHTNAARARGAVCGEYAPNNWPEREYPAGGSELSFRSSLVESAQAHAEYMASEAGAALYAHQSQGAIANAGGRSENIAYQGPVTSYSAGAEVESWPQDLAMAPEKFVQMWLDSPGHCHNMMSPRWDYIGTGLATSEDHYHYGVQLFGVERRSSSSRSGSRDAAAQQRPAATARPTRKSAAQPEQATGTWIGDTGRTHWFGKGCPASGCPLDSKPDGSPCWSGSSTKSMGDGGYDGCSAN